MAVEASDKNFEPLKRIPGLPDDLQMLGHYLKLRKKRFREHAADVRKGLGQVFKNPGDVALNADEFAKAYAASPAEAKVIERRSLDPAVYRGELHDIETMCDELDLMLLDLKKGKYGDCLTFLKESVLPAETLTYPWGDSPVESEQAWGEQRAIQSYIKLLESKSKAPNS